LLASDVKLGRGLPSTWSATDFLIKRLLLDNTNYKARILDGGVTGSPPCELALAVKPGGRCLNLPLLLARRALRKIREKFGSN